MTMPETEVGATVADVARMAVEELQRLRRQKAIDDAVLPLIRDLAMATVTALHELRVASHKVIDAWRSSSLTDPDPAELREAIEELVAASGWKRPGE
ncbi:MAG TPA: hypothetical protein VFI34_07555 [Candidatus Limnocylindrales bacterium]|nr:hypothetical protein [Candidatus Limnocylindrales bacterium]